MRSIARKEEPTITMTMKIELKLPSIKLLIYIRQNVNTLETLNILATNISRFTVVGEGEGTPVITGSELLVRGMPFSTTSDLGK